MELCFVTKGFLGPKLTLERPRDVFRDVLSLVMYITCIYISRKLLPSPLAEITSNCYSFYRLDHASLTLLGLYLLSKKVFKR